MSLCCEHYVVRRCFYHLRQLRTVRKSLTTEAAKMLFTHSLKSNAKVSFIGLLQPATVSLECKGSTYHAEAKIRPHHGDTTRRPTLATNSSANSTIVYKCMRIWNCTILSDRNVHPIVAASTGRRNLRSAAHSDLPRTRTITYGPCSFAVSGPCVWNDLPPTLRVSPGTQTVSGLIKDNNCSVQPTWIDAFVTV